MAKSTAKPAPRKAAAKPVAPKLHPAEQYARDVLQGRIIVGKWIRLAVERHQKDLKEAGKRGLYFDPAAGEHVIEFFKFLRHSKGEWAGQCFELAPWQQFFLWVLFGWKRSDDNCRRFRVAYAEIARKNGKSTLASGVGLYLFVADGEPGAEVYTAATKRDQARIVHGEAVRMIKASPELRARVRTFKDNLSIEATNSKFEPLGADADTMDGLNPHGCIIDELHAHKTRALWDVLDTATGARRQALLFAITTAGYDRQSVCWEQHEYSQRVLSGEQDDSFFAWLAAIDEGDDWTDESCWPKANPNLGVSCKLEEMRSKAIKAKNSPPAQNGFRRLRLNQWTEQDERWLDMEVWRKCAGPVNRKALRGKRCFGGLDLGSTGDITAFVLLFDHEGPRYSLLPFFWVPKDRVAERVKKDRVRYDVWIQQGLIRTTDGNTTDYDVVRRDINKLADEFSIQEIAVDRVFQGAHLCTQLAGDGLEIIAFGQGFFSMAAPTKEFDRLLQEGCLSHGAHPVLEWMAGNVTVEQDPAGNLKPSKKKSREKIDGIVGAIMAVGRAMVAGEEGSVYDGRGCDLYEDDDDGPGEDEDDDEDGGDEEDSVYDDEDFEL
jgi:phage terminase large subunit-like protein